LGEGAEDPYEALRERARALAAEKRASGEVPEGTGDALDRLFVEVAPGGARAAGAGLEAQLDMLGRYAFDPVIRVQPGVGPRGRMVGFVKRAIQPLAVWQLRHLTDQLNAYHLAHTEVLRELARRCAAPLSSARPTEWPSSQGGLAEAPEPGPGPDA
jgi:hypothetical protein